MRALHSNQHSNNVHQTSFRIFDLPLMFVIYIKIKINNFPNYWNNVRTSPVPKKITTYIGSFVKSL